MGLRGQLNDMHVGPPNKPFPATAYIRASTAPLDGEIFRIEGLLVAIAAGLSLQVFERIVGSVQRAGRGGGLNRQVDRSGATADMTVLRPERDHLKKSPP
jgi:hypothetical protein